MPRFRTESPLTESSSSDADSAYELEHSSDEETDVKPRTVPKYLEKMVAAAEMFDPVDAVRKCYRCWKLGVDCLLPFEKDQVDSKCNGCEKDRRSYCNVNDRRGSTVVLLIMIFHWSKRMTDSLCCSSGETDQLHS